MGKGKEIEIKVLNINLSDMKNQLIDFGVNLVAKEY